MNVNIQRLFLLTIGVLFCVLGCTRDRSNLLMPDHISSPTDTHESVDGVEASFQHDLLPILTTRCALAGCHVADGPHGLDFRTYESFTAGGEHGPAFIPGNAEESEVVEQIVSGQMPVGGPPLTDAEIQVFIDWINQQEPHDDIDPHEDAHDEDTDEDEAHDEDAHDEDVDVGHHDDADDEHDADIDDDHGDMDNGHDEDNDDDHDEDDDH